MEGGEGQAEEEKKRLEGMKEDRLKQRECYYSMLTNLYFPFRLTSVNKRPYEKVDTSVQVLDRLRKRAKPSLPDPDELATFLEQSLTDDIKIPLLRDEFDTFLISGYQDSCTAEDLETLFRVSDTESAYTFITGVLGSAIMTPSPALDGTEYSFVTPKYMSTNNMRPDFGFILNQVCPFREEEKAPNSREE
ncbi:8651_t:CDS:2, partial [Ambispora gerdemannii]